MTQIDLINNFINSRKIAVIGVSRNGDLPANAIYDKLKNADYTVWPINPNTEDINGDRCYKDIASLPDKPDSVMLASTPEVSEKVAPDCVDNRIKNVWMHHGIGQGSYSPKAAEYLRGKGIEPITQGCPMMFIKPVDPFHRILKWFKSFK